MLLPMLAIEIVDRQRSPIDPFNTTGIDAHAIRVRTRKVKRLNAARRAKRVASNLRTKAVRASFTRYPLEVAERHNPVQKIFEHTN